MQHATLGLMGPNRPLGPNLPGGIKNLWQSSEFPDFGQVQRARRQRQPVRLLPSRIP